MTASRLAPASDAPVPESAEPGITAGTPDDRDADTAGSQSSGITVPSCPRLPLSMLAPHPDNKRENITLDPEFVASIKESGIRVPIKIVPLITTDADDGAGPKDGPRFTIVDGACRYYAGLEAGVPDAPVDFDADLTGDMAGQYLDMFTTSRHRRDLTAMEEADALFAAHRAGATQTVIRKKTGLGRDEVKAAIKAGGLGSGTRAKASAAYDLTLDQLALLGEFEYDDDDAVEEILRDIRAGGSGQHSAERIRQRQARKIAADTAREQLTADGYQVTDTLPEGASYLRMLLHDGEDLTPERHASCPGRAVMVPDWDPDGDPYCSDPAAHGHSSRFASRAASSTGTSVGTPETGPEGASRQLVRDGNLAWIAAAKVRHVYLKNLCGRATVSRDAQLFIARQLLAMPAPAAAKLGSARHENLFRELTGDVSPERLDGWKPGRLPLISLALVITSYEVLLTSDAGKACWRETRERRFPPVSREDAGTYFALLATLGHELSTIEQAMADGDPYTGETALDPGAAALGKDPARGTDDEELSALASLVRGEPTADIPANSPEDAQVPGEPNADIAKAQTA